MNFFTGILFGLLFAVTAGAAFAFMWKSMSMVQDEYKKPRSKYFELIKNQDQIYKI